MFFRDGEIAVPYKMSIRRIVYMKATGIVRRIDARVIITPRAIKPHKHWVFRRFLKKNF